MIAGYFLRGLLIGLVFGVPAGAIGVLTIQRTLEKGFFAGLVTGSGSSAADLIYSWGAHDAVRSCDNNSRIHRKIAGGSVTMKEDLEFHQRLKELGAPDALILQYQRYLESDNRQGQERLLYRFRGLQSERLQKDREKLFCLDYIISMVENL